MSRKTMDKFLEIINKSPFGILVVNSDSEILFVNPSACGMYGCLESDLLGQVCGCFLDKEICEITVTRDDGTYIPVECQVDSIEWEGAPCFLITIREVSERRKRLLDLKETRSKFHYIFERSPVGMSFIGRDYRFLDANPAMCNLLGYEKEELLTKTIFDITYEDDIDLSRDRIEKLRCGEETVVRVEKRYITKYGKVLWARVVASTFRDERGGLSYYLTSVEDVSDRKEKERIIEEQHKFVENILMSIQDGISVLDRDLNVVKVNPKMEEWYSYQVPFIGKKCYEVYHGRQSPCEVCPTLESMAQNCPTSKVVPKIGEDGSIVGWQDLHAFPITDPDTKDVTGVIEHVRDITETKAYQDALTQSEARYRELFDTIENGVAIYEPTEDGNDFVILDLNKCSERLDGVNKQDVIGKRVTEVFPGVRDFGLLDVFKRVNTTGQPETHPVTEYRDDRLHAWRENSVYKASSGEIVSVYVDLTEKRAAEEALKLSEERYRTVADFAYDWEMWINPVKDLLYISPSCERITGYSADEFLENKDLLFDIIHEDDRDIVSHHLGEYLTSGKVCETALDFRIVHKSGETVWINHVCTPVTGSDKRYMGRRVSHRDITDRKLLEEDLIRARDEWEATFDAIPDYICILGKDFRILRINRSMREALDISYDDLGKTKCYEVVHKTDSPNLECPHRQTFLNGIQHTAEIFEPSLNKYFEVTVAPIFDDGSVVRCVHIMTDITIRKEAENRLRQSRDEFQTIFESSPDMVYVNDLEGYFVRVNQKFTEVLGLTSEEVIGKVPYWDGLLFSNEDDFSELNHLLEEKNYCLDGHRTVFLNKRGEEVNVALSTDLIKIEGKSHVLTIAKDITDFIRLEDQLQQTSKMEAIGILAGGIAHDFNNALTPVLNATSTLLEIRNPGDVYTEDDVEFLREADDAARKTADISRQLLQISRRQVFKMGPANINEMVRKLSKLVSRYVPATIQVEVLIDEKIPRLVYADETQLSQSLLNLVLNSSDAMPRGGKIKIETRLEYLDRSYTEKYTYAREGDFIRLSVSDNGIGIPKKVLSKIFDPFFTTKSIGKGTGLGLSRVFSTMKGHDGWVNVYSEVGKGTCIKLYVPAVEVDVEGLEKVEEEVSLRDIPRGNERILVVDDFESILKTARNILTYLGYVVSTATNGEEALDIVKKEKIDLIISDLIMPRMGGKRLIKKLRSLGFNIPIVLMSGYPEAMVNDDKPIEVFDGFVEKPFKSADLGRIIRNVLDKKE